VGKIQYFLANLDLTKYDRLTERLDNSVDEARNEDMAPSKGGTDKYQGQKSRQPLPMPQSRSRRDWTMVFTASASVPKRCGRNHEVVANAEILMGERRWRRKYSVSERLFTISSSCIPPRGKYLLYCTPSNCLLHQPLRLPTHPYDAYAVQKTCRWHQTHLSLPEASRTMTAVRQVMNMSWRDHRAKYGFIESLLSKSVSISSLSSGITNGHGPDHAGASKKSLHIIVSHVSQAK
jgi:hypothetical protein